MKSSSPFIDNEETIESLVAEFNGYGKAAAEDLIRRYRSLARAKPKAKNDKEGKKRFKEFCDGTRLNPKSSTIRKFALIGQNADWLLPIADRLPPDWTTIYNVVTLGQAKAEELIHSGVLHSQTTGKELKAATSKASDKVAADLTEGDTAETTSTTEECILQVDASDLSDSDRKILYDRLVSAAEAYGLAVRELPDRLAEQVIIEREAA